jgi:hypothetical protein
VRPEGLGEFKNFIHLIESRTRGLPACIVGPVRRADNLCCDAMMKLERPLPLPCEQSLLCSA